MAGGFATDLPPRNTLFANIYGYFCYELHLKYRFLAI